MAEQVLQGVSAAPGVLAGEAMVLGRFVDDVTLEHEQRPGELERARVALRAEITALEELAGGLRAAGSSAGAEIIEAGALMAEDPTLLARIEELVLGAGRSAPAAIACATEEVASTLARLQDPTLAERAADVRSLGRRAAAYAAGAKLRAGGVLIATDLGPADVADLGLAASGAALAEGGVTAHAAIVARSLGIPMVVGLGAEALSLESGEIVVLDADRGLLVRRPTEARIAAATEAAAQRRRAREAARQRRDELAQTTDGHRVTVLVNAATMAEGIEGFEQGAEGIGLLRTELPFLDAEKWPSVGRQVEFLRPILECLGDRPATVRLFDFGADKTPPFLRGTDKRGIDLLLDSHDALPEQLTAIVEAAGDAEVRILVPMVVSAHQMTTIRVALAEVAGTERKRPALGAMIETVEAARNAPAIAEVSDFFSIGTNDLTQAVLGLDRERSKSAPTTDVRVLRAIDAAVRAGHAAGIPVDVCGEAASDPRAMPILVGLGVDELSVAAARVGQVRQWIRELDYADCREAAGRTLLDEVGHTPGQRV
jgi:phosphoenolpyruvate-protein kinase (PTS system EI component)